MMKILKNKLGFTLVEIVTTTAIIGTLSAIAIPNLLRIKMNVNEEMVKQHLRIIAQEMNDLYNKTNPHLFPEDILTLDGDPEEELSITASLNAIGNKGYGIRYTPIVGSKNAGPSNFLLRADPLPGMFGISGVNCFKTDPSVNVIVIDCGSAEGMAMTVIGGVDPWFFRFFRDIFAGGFTDTDLKALTGFFELQALNYFAFGNQSYGINNSINNIPALEFMVGIFDASHMREYFPEIQKELKKIGINAYMDPTERVGGMYKTDPGDPYSGLTSTSKFHISFVLDNPITETDFVKAQDELEMRKSNSKYIQIYKDFESCKMVADSIRASC